MADIQKMTETNEERTTNFIREFIDDDLREGKYDNVHTRFPPEPNGYLHIGHAKSIHLNYGLARDYKGKLNLRFDDTNPVKEEQEYIDAIIRDVKWLGADWGDQIYYASDYFDQLYDWAVQLIKQGKAYVDDQSAEEIRKTRGTLTQPGTDSPYRSRSVEENLDLFERMKNGEFPDGSRILRAKIDMASPNMSLRDPAMYRILHAEHPRTGHKWSIYPLYDWAHGQSDSIEGITHSICTLEFENNRALYNWFIEQLGIYAPRQIEFARLNFTHTVLSKRKLIQLVEGNYVRGWDDPRMPTISGIRRRGYTPESLRAFCEAIGVSKANSKLDWSMLEYYVRQDLNARAQRRFAVLNPIKLVITNYPEDAVEEMEVNNNPEDPNAGTRVVPFSRELYIEVEDFMEEPAPKFYRLSPGKEVRLRNAYFVTCDEVIKDEQGNITELRCTYDPATRGGDSPDGRKVKATLHWLSAAHAVKAEVRLYEALFNVPDPGDDWLDQLNPDSMQVLDNAYIEPNLLDAQVGERFQFERIGYFNVDPDSSRDKMVFNRTATLKDSYRPQ